MTKELKACPFCGGHVHEMHEVDDYGDVWYMVMCSTCGGSAGKALSADTAREYWEERAS